MPDLLVYPQEGLEFWKKALQHKNLLFYITYSVMYTKKFF